MAVDMAVEVIGVVSGGMTIYTFLESMFNGGSDPTTPTKYRIAAGLDGTPGPSDELNNAGGDVEQIYSYNNNFEEIGRSSWLSTFIADGGFADLQTPTYHEQQSQYSEIFAGNDAICIAYITVQFSHGSSRRYGVTGDWAETCGLAGYPSGVSVGTKTGGTNTPRCIWLDKNHDVGEASKLGIYWQGFEKAFYEEHHNRPEELCGYKWGFRAWRDHWGGPQLAKRGEDDFSSSSHTNLTARSPLPRGEGGGLNRRVNVINGAEYYGQLDDRLVVSHFPQHNATDICANPLNLGPDFFSVHEGVYCDMETRKTKPLCESDMHGDVDVECFDLAASAGDKFGVNRSRPVPVTRGPRSSKKPTKVIEWMDKGAM